MSQRNYDFAVEWPKILACATTFGVDPYAIAAIRVAENGASGREFGVLSTSAPDYSSQLRVACVSLRNRLLAYGANGYEYNGRLCLTMGFVKYFAQKWAPPLVANDPTDLNANWSHNFWEAYCGFVDKDGPVAWQQLLTK